MGDRSHSRGQSLGVVFLYVVVQKKSVLGLVQYLGVVSSVQMGLLMHGVEFCACLSRVEDMSGLAVFWDRRSSQYSIWCLSVCLKGGGGKWMEGESE